MVSRWKAWYINYEVNNTLSSVNYGGSYFVLITPIFSINFKHWDCDPMSHQLISSISLCWNLRFKKLAEGGDNTITLYRKIQLSKKDMVRRFV